MIKIMHEKPLEFSRMHEKNTFCVFEMRDCFLMFLDFLKF